MAKPTTAAWSKLLIQVENPAVPGVYSAPCGLTSRGLAFSAETSDVVIDDCDDPSAPGWTERVKTSLSAGISGSGVLALEALPMWRAWLAASESWNVRVKIDLPGASNGGHYEGRFVLTSLNLSGNKDDGKINVEVEASSDGEVAWVDAA